MVTVTGSTQPGQGWKTGVTLAPSNVAENVSGLMGGTVEHDKVDWVGGGRQVAQEDVDLSGALSATGEGIGQRAGVRDGIHRAKDVTDLVDLETARHVLFASVGPSQA